MNTSGHAWLLWDNHDGTYALWNTDASGNLIASHTYGPFGAPGGSRYAAVALSAGPSNTLHILWASPSGYEILWNLDNAFNFSASIPNGPYTDGSGGPLYAPVSLSTGADGVSHILWTASNGHVIFWNVQPNFSFGSFGPYGPFTDDGTVNTLWKATTLAAGPNGTQRVLWTNPDGRTILWSVDSGGGYTILGNYAPGSDDGTPNGIWKAVALAAGSDGVSHILWTNLNGNVRVWNVSTSGGFTVVSTYGPNNSLTCQAIAVGNDNKTRLLWSGANGVAQVWVMNSDGSYIPFLYSAYATLAAPLNLSVQGTTSQGSPTDVLSWSPVAGAVSYNVYQYGTTIATNVTATTCIVPTTNWVFEMPYSVTSVDGMGMESLPSAIASGEGPANSSGTAPGSAVTPTAVTARPEWNVGSPRIHLMWRGSSMNSTYNVYRNGVKIGSELWGLNFYDSAVAKGQSYTYTVTGVSQPWVGPWQSKASAAVIVTAPAAANAAGGIVQITGVQPNDDSVVVSFAAVPGAFDYRVYNTANPNTVKYSGGGLSVEMNGLNPAGATLVVQAVDKLGPFQTMDGMAGPGAMRMDGVHVAINGQGDPSNVPNVIASSAAFPVTCSPAGLTGSQIFFDNFRNDPVPTLLQNLPPQQGEFYGLPGQYAEYDNTNWAIRNYGGDINDSAAFFMGGHFMDTLYDGGTPHGNLPIHNNNASLVMMPKATADISGGRVLHVTFEVDAHFDLRRWCDVVIAPSTDTLISPGLVEGESGTITTSGNLFRWEIQGGFHLPEMFINNVKTQLVNVANGINSDNPNVERDVVWQHGPANTSWQTMGVNGSSLDLDKRHKFDLYLSQTHFRLLESGQLIKDADFTASQRLPFSNCQVYFVHVAYHTHLDRTEGLDSGYNDVLADLTNTTTLTYPDRSYWYNYRPWADERHWDNMGYEVLTAFP